MKKIFCVDGHVTLVDLEDFERLNAFKWRTIKIGDARYVFRHQFGRKIYMHREVLNPEPRQIIDHINMSGLDNRKKNLRFCTPSQNQANRRPCTKNPLQLKGVRWRLGKYDCFITYHYKQKYLGRFECPKKAARAYDRAARALFGEFARLNFPEEK